MCDENKRAVWCQVLAFWSILELSCFFLSCAGDVSFFAIYSLQGVILKKPNSAFGFRREEGLFGVSKVFHLLGTSRLA